MTLRGPASGPPHRHVSDRPCRPSFTVLRSTRTLFQRLGLRSPESAPPARPSTFATASG